MHGSVIGNEHLERDDCRGEDGGDYRREHEVIDTEDQHHDYRRDEVVEKQARAGAEVPTHNSDRCSRQGEEHQSRDHFAESVQQRDQQEDRAAGQVEHGDPHNVLAHYQALDAEEDADDSADAGCDGQNPEVTGHGLGIVSRQGRKSALERYVRYADASHLDHHGESVIPWMSLPAVSAT
ncbi:MAG: hypothetical protein QOG79_7328 [Mycobacterium sp.]|nr:hypothetical protein [Mycobacterium sp.]